MKFLFNKIGLAKKILLFAVENLFLLSSLFMAIQIRFLMTGSDIRYYVSFDNGFLLKVLVFLSVYQLCFYYADFSIFRSFQFRRDYLLKILESSIWVSITLFIIYYLFPSVAIGRGIFILNLFVSTPVLFFAGICGKKILYSNRFQEKVLIIGTGVQAKEIADAIMQNESSGFHLFGFVDEFPRKIGNRIVHPTSDIMRLVHRNNINRIIMAMEDRRGNFPTNALLKCKLMGVEVEDAISFQERLSSKIIVKGLKPSWFIYSDGFMVARNKKIIKRTMDIVLSSVAFLFAAPLFLLIPIAIKLESNGPVIFKQKRVGEGGKIFIIMKFRSMIQGAESVSGPVWADENDERITSIGSFLRKTRLDELPQIINVLKGDMSLIGPRPERPHFVAQLRKQIPYYMLRLTVKPGITGWAQVKYQYASSVMDTQEKLQYDLYYIKHLGVALDMFIIWGTLKVIITTKGAK